MANAGGFSEERIVTPVGAGEVRKGGGDACVAHGGQMRSGRRTGRRATQASPPHATPLPPLRYEYPSQASRKNIRVSHVFVGSRCSIFNQISCLLASSVEFQAGSRLKTTLTT